MRAEQVTDPVAYHGEGPVWFQRWGGLRWVDMLAGDLGLSQPQHDPEHQEANVHALCGVKNDSHPRTPIAVCGVGVQQAGYERISYYPGHVKMIESEE